MMCIISRAYVLIAIHGKGYEKLFLWRERGPGNEAMYITLQGGLASSPGLPKKGRRPGTHCRGTCAIFWQLEVLQSVYGGHDIFAWFPTGYGKSLCYQLLPYMFDVKLGLTKTAPSERSVV